MNRTTLLTAAALLLAGSGVAMAAGGYNDPPTGDAQYAQCLRVSLNRYTGGTEASPVSGQSKVQAFCTCMWNETPDNFKGNLVTFSETAKGAATNKVCEKHADWEG